MLIEPGLGLVFWMIVVFAALLFILKKYAWIPILNMLHERESSIEEALHAADRAKEEMQQLKFDNEKLLKEAKNERDAIMQAARKVRDTIIDEAKEKASQEADRIIESAKESIHYEKMSAMTELKNQIAGLSIEIAEKILNEELSPTEKQKDLIKKHLDKVNFN
ncbi:MAG: F0F1 ATP synthase subunit B [Saprospiraceae bacterium]|nr:F0F1 ATP synthase subunit B [Saprospiraceae bacterium]